MCYNNRPEFFTLIILQYGGVTVWIVILAVVAISMGLFVMPVTLYDNSMTYKTLKQIKEMRVIYDSNLQDSK